MSRPERENAPAGQGLGREGKAADDENVEKDDALLGADLANNLIRRANLLADSIPFVLTATRRRATKLAFCRCWCGALAIRRGESFDFGEVA